MANRRSSPPPPTVLLEALSGRCYIRYRRCSCPPISVPTGLLIHPLIPSGSYSSACSSSTRTRPSTCLLASTRHATIKLWWNSAPFRGGSKSLFLTDEQVATLADCQPAIRDSMCVGGDRVITSARVATFDYTRRGGTARPDCLSARSTLA